MFLKYMGDVYIIKCYATYFDNNSVNTNAAFARVIFRNTV